MKLDRLQELVTTFAITVSGILVAVFLGSWAGKGDQRHITILLGSLAYILLFFKMRQNIWLLIPLTMPLVEQCHFLPLPFSVKQLAILIVFGSYITLIAVKIVRTDPKYDLLDLILLLNLLYSVTVYARNPVGTLAVGSERIGGKPYVDLIVGILGYWTLSRVVATSSQLRKIPYLMFFGTAATTGLSIIANRFPSTAPFLNKLYSGVDISVYNADQENLEDGGGDMPEEGVNRKFFFEGIGWTTATLLVSYFRPATLINPFYLMRFLAFGLSFAAVLVSGFRSGLMTVAALFFLSSYLQDKLGGLFRLCLFTGFSLTIVLLGQGSLFELPFNIQRTLSFLPGKWDPAPKGDAEGSTKWRQEMWKQAMGNSMLGSTKYIKSKLFGDGPGFDKAELANFQRKGAGNEGQQEDLMISGGFHSGPVSTLRNVGFVGGILFYILMFYTAVHAYKLIERTRGTPFFPMALFIGMPMMWSPFAFTFIFGAFESGFPSTIINIGFLKMIDQSLTASHATERSSSEKPMVELRNSGSRNVPTFAGSSLAGGMRLSGD